MNSSMKKYQQYCEQVNAIEKYYSTLSANNFKIVEVIIAQSTQSFLILQY
jgi:hypothetical protein